MQNNPLLSRITLLPGICGGKPTIRGMRIPVQVVLEALAAGDGKEDILEGYSALEEEDIEACLAFAAKLSSFEVGESYLLGA